MSLFDGVAGALTGLSDFAGDMLGSLELFGDNSAFIGDILGGAVTNAAIAGIAGGDIGKAAMFGAVGGAFNEDSSVFGDLAGYGNELGGAIAGFGVGGLEGAAGGALSAYALDANKTAGTEASSGVAADEMVAGNNEAANLNNAPVGGGGAFKDKMVSLGIMTPEGDGTLLGKGLLGGIAGLAQEKSQSDLLDKQQQIAQENAQRRQDMDYQAEQQRMGAFTGKAPAFKIQRS